MKRHAGFTLLEVMVALAVLAIALGAIIQSVGASSNTAGYLRDKTMANWVASNKMAEIQSVEQVPTEGKGTEEMAGYEWHWSVTVKDAKVDMEQLSSFGIKAPNLKTVTVEVRKNGDDKQSIATLTADIGLPASGF